MNNIANKSRRDFLKTFGIGLALGLCNLPGCTKKLSQQATRPNVLLIMSDNHSAWQLGCYGNPDIYSPNIDKLAKDGMRFTRAMSCNPVCSPTRASILTGLIPSQHGVLHWLINDNLQVGPDAKCTISEFTTLPEVLNNAGYYCGLVGKWHLGDNLHPQEGFKYWVTMPTGLTKNFYDVEVVEDGKIKKEPGYITEFWTKHAIQFLEQAQSYQEKDKQPFYLHLTYNGPYSLDPNLLVSNPERVRNRHTERYANMPMNSFPRLKPHKGMFKHTGEFNDIRAIRASAAQISGVDDGIGDVLAALERFGLKDNTLVIFCADQGVGGGYNGIWGMGHNVKPSVAYDKILNVPLIICHPGNVQKNKQNDFLVNNYDLMPTILDYVGLSAQMPSNSPGRSFSPVLNGKKQEWDNVTFYEHFYTRAIRTDRWKYVFRHEEPDDLFDLDNDPLEHKNLAENPVYQDEIQKLKKRLDDFFEKYANPKYDIMKGGKSKSWHPPFIEPNFVPIQKKTRYYDYTK
jgi:arylsulfatase A-like enzyme